MVGIEGQGLAAVRDQQVMVSIEGSGMLSIEGPVHLVHGDAASYGLGSGDIQIERK